MVNFVVIHQRSEEIGAPPCNVVATQTVTKTASWYLSLEFTTSSSSANDAVVSKEELTVTMIEIRES